MLLLQRINETNMNQFQQAQKMIEKMNEMQELLAKLDVTGESGAGLVKVCMNCKNEVRFVRVDKSLVIPSDVEILEDLIVAAFNDARRKVEAQVESETKKMSLGLPKLPGFSL